MPVFGYIKSALGAYGSFFSVVERLITSILFIVLSLSMLSDGVVFAAYSRLSLSLYFTCSNFAVFQINVVMLGHLSWFQWMSTDTA